MDSLQDKQYKNYDYISRYSAFPFYYNVKDNKYIYGIMKQLDTADTPFSVHKIKDSDTVDSLALKYYGRPDFYWIICMFNGINDPFIQLNNKFDTIKIPSLSSIHWSN